ncbi:nitrogen fixation protein NifM [Thiorhodospira sibirica]|uniref:nitrogen fixation protein NifM n=1 Tax=Thiorhodospira sibirica TaxID=154347 RepID=UPI00022C33F1|nr:nitrogen fixation protein NifM [Thiorhodospira sibirica]
MQPAPLMYLRMKAALEQYGRPWSVLDAAQQAKVAAQADKAYALGCRALATPLAHRVTLPAEAVSQAVAEIQQRYPEKQPFYDDLKAHGLDVAGLHDALTHELRVQAVLERVSAQAAEVHELELRLYYQRQMHRFEAPERRTVRHILITINPQFAENTPEHAQQRIQQIREAIMQQGKDFAELAGRHSECPSSLQGGLLGTVPQGTLYPELEAVLFTLEAGQISEAVCSEVGLHLLYCEQIHPAGRIPFSEAREVIKTRLTQRRQQNCQRLWLAALG